MFYYNLPKDDVKRLGKMCKNLAKALCAFHLPISDIRKEALERAEEFTYMHYQDAELPNFSACAFKDADGKAILAQIDKGIDEYFDKNL